MMRATMTIATTLALLLLPVSELRAQSLKSVSDWVAALKGEHEALQQLRAKSIVIGAGSAYSWANSILRREGQRPLFCEPEKLSLNEENFRGIVLDEYSRMEQFYKDNEHAQKFGHSFLALVLLQGLKRTFPCGQSQ